MIGLYKKMIKILWQLPELNKQFLSSKLKKKIDENMFTAF